MFMNQSERRPVEIIIYYGWLDSENRMGYGKIKACFY